MRLSVFVVGLAVLAAPAFGETGPGEGAATYETNCKVCHGGGLPNAPTQDKLAAMTPDAIVAALDNPKPIMAGVVSGLSDEEKRNVAVFLTKKSLPAKGNLPEVKAE